MNKIIELAEQGYSVHIHFEPQKRGQASVRMTNTQSKEKGSCSKVIPYYDKKELFEDRLDTLLDQMKTEIAEAEKKTREDYRQRLADYAQAHPNDQKK
jgi:hypothetical protein